MYNPNTISVVIATYNRPNSLVSLLEQLDDQRCVNGGDLDVTVVDDGSSRDLSNELGRAFRFRFEYIYRPRHPQNLSRVYSSRNMAAKVGQGRYILQLDDDLEFTPYYLNLLQTAAAFVPHETFVWCPRISNNTDVDSAGYAAFERGKDGRWYDGQAKWQHTHWQSTTSAGMFMPRDLWDRVGGYDEQFDGCMGAGDQELALRCQKAGASIFLYPAFVNIADEETGSYRMAMIDRAIAMGRQRNETLFEQKHPDAQEWTRET
jgi:glycosyltransferase involved in cell wall biosynthesis